MTLVGNKATHERIQWVNVYTETAPNIYFVIYHGTTKELSQEIGFGDDLDIGTGVVLQEGDMQCNKKGILATAMIFFVLSLGYCFFFSHCLVRLLRVQVNRLVNIQENEATDGFNKKRLPCQIV